MTSVVRQVTLTQWNRSACTSVAHLRPSGVDLPTLQQLISYLVEYICLHFSSSSPTQWSRSAYNSVAYFRFLLDYCCSIFSFLCRALFTIVCLFVIFLLCLSFCLHILITPFGIVKLLLTNLLAFLRAHIIIFSSWLYMTYIWHRALNNKQATNQIIAFYPTIGFDIIIYSNPTSIYYIYLLCVRMHSGRNYETCLHIQLIYFIEKAKNMTMILPYYADFKQNSLCCVSRQFSCHQSLIVVICTFIPHLFYFEQAN